MSKPGSRVGRSFYGYGMTLVQAPAALSPLAEDRARRLVDAGTAWNNRIAADATKAQLTYRVTATGEGSVATRVTAGKHVFLVDEPGALAGDDVAASPVEIALGALLSCQVVVYRLYAQALGIQVDEIAAHPVEAGACSPVRQLPRRAPRTTMSPHRLRRFWSGLFWLRQMIPSSSGIEG